MYYTPKGRLEPLGKDMSDVHVWYIHVRVTVTSNCVYMCTCIHAYIEDI